MNKYLDIKYLKTLDVKPYYFGLGFIQMKLNDRERIHFWHPKFQPMEPEETHNHRYDFTSKILSGQIVHETWEFLETVDLDSSIDRHLIRVSPGFLDKVTHELVEVSCSPIEKTDPIIKQYGFAKLTGKYTMNAGDEYWFEGSQFHRTNTTGAVTFLDRGPITQEKALVIRPKGTAGSCPFSIKYSDDEIWRLIEETIEVTR